MKVKAPFAIETRHGQDSYLVMAGYTVRQYLTHIVRGPKRRGYKSWWLWGYVQSEDRNLSAKELAL